MINDEATRWLGEELAPDPSFVGEAMREVTEKLLAAGWAPPPTVYLAGDEVPCHLPVIDEHGEVRNDYQDYDELDGEVYTANFTVVHMNIDYDAAVRRERVKRGIIPAEHVRVYGPDAEED